AGAQETATMAQARAGRSAYINAQQLEGNVDPGAEAVAVLFEHLARR
ncbi:DAK2 domain-containing protein, partial [Nitratireductor aquibiodomus]